MGEGADLLDGLCRSFPSFPRGKTNRHERAGKDDDVESDDDGGDFDGESSLDLDFNADVPIPLVPWSWRTSSPGRLLDSFSSFNTVCSFGNGFPGTDVVDSGDDRTEALSGIPSVPLPALAACSFI